MATPNVAVGDIVHANGREATVRFVGPTSFAKGVWYVMGWAGWAGVVIILVQAFSECVVGELK